MQPPSDVPTTQPECRSYTFRSLGLVMNPQRLPAARQMLADEGVSAWARRHGFRPKSVHDVLSGKRPCIRGESHRIAKALDLFQSTVK